MGHIFLEVATPEGTLYGGSWEETSAHGGAEPKPAMAMPAAGAHDDHAAGDHADHADHAEATAAEDDHAGHAGEEAGHVHRRML